MNNPEGPREVLRDIIFSALVTAPSAWQTTFELARRLGFDHHVLCDELASMDIAGLITVWERPDDVAVSISALAARARGLHLVHGPASGVWCWEPAPKPASRPPAQPARSAQLGTGLRRPPRGPEPTRNPPMQAFQNPVRGHICTKPASEAQGMS